MKLLSIKRGGEFRTGILLGGEVLDLELATPHIEEIKTLPMSMRGLLAGGDTTIKPLQAIIAQTENSTLKSQLRDVGAMTSFKDAELGPVVPDPQLVLSGSMNSWGHLKEMEDEAAEHPCAFVKFPSSLSSSGADIVLPPKHPNMIDWEGEFCVVIGKRCHNVTREEADDYIFGYTLMNDVSAREFAMEFIQSGGSPPVAIAQAWERNVFGKNFPTFCPVGPVIVSKDELPSPFSYQLKTIVNGEVMQSSTQEDVVFDQWDLISYFSEFLVFEPGDIISLGSPPGVGMARNPQVFLKHGDVVTVECPDIGVLSNKVVKR